MINTRESELTTSFVYKADLHDHWSLATVSEFRTVTKERGLDPPVKETKRVTVRFEQELFIVTSDPRIAGMWYFTLVMTTEAVATKLATFCRARGLETYVINSDDAGLYRVIALPGSNERNDPNLNRTLHKIHAIGRKWTDTPDGRGNDLRDAYPSLKPSAD